MLSSVPAHLRRILLPLIFILSVVALPLAVSQTAEASLYVCRGDPVVMLSNGLKLTLTVDLTVPPAQVASVVYTIHGPAKSQLKKVTYLVDQLAGKESVVLVRDSVDNNYHVTVVARVTSGAQGSVLVTGLNKSLMVTSLGLTGQPLTITISAHK